MTSRHPKQSDKTATTSQPLVSNPQPAPWPAPLQPAAVVQRAAQSPAALTPAEVLQLHRTIGNRAVGQLVRGHLSRHSSGPAAAPGGTTVQPKLLLGPVGDRYEQEADRVAQQVVQRLDAEAPPAAGPAVQRQEEDDKELLQMQPAGIPPQHGERGFAVSPDLETAIHHARGGGEPLPETVRGRMEQAFGADFGGVRLHADAQADTLNRALAAKAFTTGQDIFFEQSAYQPGSSIGRDLLAHELTHVIQQGRGMLRRVQPQSKGPALSADTALAGLPEAAATGASTTPSTVLKPPDVGLMTKPDMEPLIQRAPLDYYATKEQFNSAFEYFRQVVDPWLDDVQKRHPEAARDVEDARFNIEEGSYDISTWPGVALIISHVNGAIGKENPHVRGEIEEVEVEPDYSVGWRSENADLTRLPGAKLKQAREDLKMLIAGCGGNIHSGNVHTVVGGTATKGKVKKVSGLNDSSARIDVQSPPAEGVYNLQYQVSNASVANVIFVGEDPSDFVLAKLLDSFDNGMKLVSPRVPVRNGELGT